MADATFTEGSPVSVQGVPVSILDQPKKGKPKSVNARGKQPVAPALLKSPPAAKIRASMSPLPAPQKSPKLIKSPKAAKPQNPTMLNMVLEALKDNKSPKGLTVQGIKRYITEKYPHTKETFSNARFRQALTKGTESNEILRPKSSEDSGLKGYFILNRTIQSLKDKVKPKENKTKKAGSEEKAKPANKVAKKAKSVLKTSGSAKTASPKPKTAKTKLASKSEPKAAKTKPASKSEPRKALKKTPTKKTPTKKTPTKKTPTKKTPTKKTPTKRTPLKKTAVKKSLKATSTPKATATPKLSKSVKAGSRQKTAAVKKLMKTAE